MVLNEQDAVHELVLDIAGLTSELCWRGVGLFKYQAGVGILTSLR